MNPIIEASFRSALEKLSEVEIVTQKEPLNSKREDAMTFLNRIGIDKFQALIFENKVRLKGLIQEHHEGVLLSRLESVCQGLTNISDVPDLDIATENMKFFIALSEIDQKLILALAPKEFINTLSQELKDEARPLQQKVVQIEQRDNQRLSIEDSSDSSEEEDVPPQLERRNVILTEERKDQDSDFASISFEEEEEKEAAEDLIDSLYELIGHERNSQIDDDDNNRVVEVASTTNLDKSSLVTSGRKTVNQINTVILPAVFPEVTDLERESTVFNNQATHNEAVDEEVPIGLFDIDDLESETSEDSEPLEMLHQVVENKECYEWLHQIGPDDNYELQFFKSRVPYSRSLRERFLMNESISYPVKDLNRFDELEDFLNHLVTLLVSNKSNDAIMEKSSLCRLNLSSLVNKFLILEMLDPSKEVKVLPLLVLMLMEYIPKFIQTPIKKNSLNQRIMDILYQYALRAPSVFFKSIEWSQIIHHFDQEKFAVAKDPKGTFTLFDLMFKHYIIFCTKKKGNEANIFPRILFVLIQIRFITKAEGAPKFILSLQESETELLEGTTLEQLLNISEKSTNIPIKIGIRRYCQWLKYLSYVSQYRPAIFQICNQLLSAGSSKEQEKLEAFINHTKEMVKLPSQIVTQKQRDKCLNLLNQIPMDSSDVLEVLDFTIGEANKGMFDARSVIKENNTYNKKFNSISLFHLEALDLISMLVGKGLLANDRDLKKRSRDILRLPFQFHFYLLKLKQLENSIQNDENEAVADLMAKRDASITDTTPPPTLERSYSLLRKEEEGFEGTFVQWMTKSKDMLSDTLSDLNQDQKNYDLYMQAMRKFPWTLSFQLKDRILR